MKKLFLQAMALTALFGGPAMAADMPVKAVYKTPVVEVWTWDRFYIGLNGGYSWGRSNTTGTFYNAVSGVQLSPTENPTIKLNGGVFGGQIGKNWQNGNFVLGIELDAQWSGEKGSYIFTCVTPAFGGACNGITAGPGFGVAPTTTFNQQISWFATLRPRAGILVTPTALLYVTGGLAVGGIKTDGVLSGFTGGQVATSLAWNQSTTKTGWVIGAGLEARLGGNWTGKIEGLYMDLGSVSGSPTLTTSNPQLRFDYSSRVTDTVVRVGVNYHIGGPVVAKY